MTRQHYGAFAPIALVSLLGLSLAGCGSGSSSDKTITPSNVVDPTLSVQAVLTSIPEGDTGTSQAVFKVTLSDAARGQVTVDYQTVDGTAKVADDDYTASQGTLVFAQGEIEKAVPVLIKGDTDVESDENFSFVLSNVTGNALEGNMSSTVTITNDDSVGPALPEVSVSGGGAVDEGGPGAGGEAVFTIGLNKQANGLATVTFETEDGTAKAGSDYAARSDTVQIPAGSTAVTVKVPVIGDAVPEDDETFSLKITGFSVNIQAGTVLSAEATIVNDDFGTLNDTGITGCTDGTSVGLSCNDSSVGTDAVTGQDAERGRDADPLTNSNADGHAGFSFTKLDDVGAALADQSADYATTPWSCVKDEVTDLTWEVKTSDGGLHDKSWDYTWYDFDPVTNGGNSGVAGGGSCTGSGCDTGNFVAEVNRVGLCSHNDWRLPTLQELYSLANLDAYLPSIDPTRFPNAVNDSYWTSSSQAGNASSAWAVSFVSGMTFTYGKGTSNRVRLVRGTSIVPPGSRYVDHGDGTVTDTHTGLMWMQCPEGLSSSAAACDTGAASVMDAAQALQLVKDVNSGAVADNKGYGDWRVPNEKELLSLMDVADTTPPMISSTAFPVTPSARFWTASPYAMIPGVIVTPPPPAEVWFVDFSTGQASAVDWTDTYAVRLVRDAP